MNAMRSRLLVALLAVFLLLPTACDQTVTLLPTPTPTLLPPTATPLPTPEPIEPYSPQGFDLFLAEMDGLLMSERPQFVNAFWANLPQTPLVDETRAVFLWRGEASSVSLAGDMNNWSPDAAPFERLRGTELWWYSAEFEPAARLDYKIVRNSSDFQLDPFNPNQMMGGFGLNSELRMPGYVIPPELLVPDEPIPQGTITQHTIDSLYLEQSRVIFVYEPPGQLVGALTPSVYFHDGSDYLNIIDAPALLDRLIADRAIPPVVAVFIPPVQRADDYDRDPAYTAFMVEEVVPFVRSTYDTDPAPAQTATIGASMGGLFAVHLGMSHPEVFGLVAGQSGAYMLNDNAIIRDVAGGDRRPVRLHLLAGTYETAVGGSESGNILEASRRLAGVLDSVGYDYVYVEAPEGHSWGFWQGYLGAALRYLYE
jgi:enterochelin esterase family protein